jgi:hypothetical protein
MRFENFKNLRNRRLVLAHTMKSPTFFDNVSAINCDNLAVRETVSNYF